MKQILLGSTGVNNLTANNYWSPWGQASVSSSFPERYGAVIPTELTVAVFRVDLSAAPGVGTSRTFTLKKDQVATAAVVTISDTATTGTYTGAVVFSASDVMDLQTTVTGVPAASTANWSIELSCTDAGLAVGFVHCFGTDWSTYNAPAFNLMTGPNATEANVSAKSPLAFTLEKIYVKCHGDPGGAGDGYTFTTRINGSDVAASAVTFVEPTREGNVTGLTQAVAVGDVLSIRMDVVATPSGNQMGVGYAYRPNTLGKSILGIVDVGGSPGNGAVNYASFGASAWATTTAQRHVSGPTRWRFSDLTVTLTTAPGAGNSWVFDLYVNDAGTASTVTISETDTTGTDNHKITLNEGDTVVLRSTPSSTPTATGNMQVMGVMDTVIGGGGGAGGPGRPRRPPGGGPPNPPGGGSLSGPVLKKLRFPEKVI